MKSTRQEITELLAGEALSAAELARRLRIREPEVVAHLDHVRRSLVAKGKKLRVHAAGCRKCGYTFLDRRRLSTPGRCPRCRSTYIEEPRFSVE